MRRRSRHTIRWGGGRARGARLAALAAAAGTLAGCSSGDVPTGPGDPPIASVLALHSVGQTLQRYEVGERLAVGGSVDLGPLFDGNGMDALGSIAVTTESDFGGDRVWIVDLEAGTTTGVGFAEQGVNPSRPVLVPSRSSAFVAGRGSNAIYEIPLGVPDSPPGVLARDAGEFVEKVLAADGRLFAIDSNIDDAGGTYEPLGPSRVVVFELDGREVADLELPAGFQAIDAVRSGGLVVVLNAGTLTPAFAPEGNGSLAVIDPTTLEVSGPFLLGGNGVSLEDGADGYVYASVTSDFVNLRTLRFDPAREAFLNGPSDPVATRDASGSPVACWVTTALADGRLLCATFRFEESGAIFLLQADGAFIDRVQGGFGTTDLEIEAPRG